VKKRSYDTIVIGGGSAGLAAAAEIAGRGYRVAVLERELGLGGILNQCIHNGFGLHYFKEELTGPEYAERMIDKSSRFPGIDFYLDSAVLDVKGLIGGEARSGAENDGKPQPDGGLVVYGISKREGITEFTAASIVLAMGCRERNRGNIGIPGTRPAGVFTAGLAQRLVNVDGYIPGKEVVIVGSGDIGLIMARRMTWVGARVHGVVEIQPYPSGLTRNIAQCLNDFNIPLYLSHVVSEIHGRRRVEGVTITPIEDHHEQPGKSFRLDCDTLLLSVGLVPDNELSRRLGVVLNPETGGPYVDASLMTSVPGVFACGNVLHVHDLVDWVTEESSRCGSNVCDFLAGEATPWQGAVAAGANVKYVLPNRYTPSRKNVFYLRTLVVKNGALLRASLSGRTLLERRLAHVQPSEMVTFTLGPDAFAGGHGAAAKGGLADGRLEVSVE